MQWGSSCIDRVQIVVLAFAAAVRPITLKNYDAGFGGVLNQAAS